MRVVRIDQPDVAECAGQQHARTDRGVERDDGAGRADDTAATDREPD